MDKPPKIARLDNRGLLRLGGPDRFTYLQGLVSQDVAPLQEGKPIFTALLTPQGKYLFDFFVIPHGDDLLIDCEMAAADELLRRLSFFKMRHQIWLSNVSPHHVIHALWDGAAEYRDVYADPRLAVLGSRRITAPEEAIAVTHTVADYREHRYRHGVPEGREEIESGHAVLLDANFDHLNAISWKKGCYMGQELTARTHYRGLTKKRYLPFRFEGAVPDKHHHIRDHGFEIGTVQAIGSEYGLGLFYLEKIRPFITEGKMLVDAGTSYTVMVPEYLKSVV
jgi:folate-binding protein YgfZ